MIVKPIPLNVMFLVPSLGRGGAEAQVVDLVNGINKDMFNPTLVSFESGLDRLPDLDRDGVEFIHVPRRRFADVSLIARIAAIAREKRIDMIHCTLQIALLIGWGAAQLMRKRPRLIGAVHTTVSRNSKNAFIERYLYRQLMGLMDATIFVCEEQLKYWQRVNGYRYNNSAVVHNGIDTSRFCINAGEWACGLRLELKIPESSRVACCIAAFRPEKGQMILIEALEMLSSQIGDLHLILAGDGSERCTVEKFVAEKPALQGRVHFLGALADVRPVIEASDFLVIPSTAVETFSISMLESMSMERPVIATDIGGAREAVITRETGILVPSGSPLFLADAMKEMLECPAIVKRMGCTARSMVLERFDRRKMIIDTEDIMHSVANKGRLKEMGRHSDHYGREVAKR